jgi:hypothetical protein
MGLGLVLAVAETYVIIKVHLLWIFFLHCSNISQYTGFRLCCAFLKVWPAKRAWENEFEFAASYRTRSEYSDILSIAKQYSYEAFDRGITAMSMQMSGIGDSVYNLDSHTVKLLYKIHQNTT